MAEKISAECSLIEKMLLQKNAAYGNSALQPVRIFSKANNVEQLLVRIDDKLSRVAKGKAAGEDVITDLIGYFVLLRIALKEQPEQSPAAKDMMDRAWERHVPLPGSLKLEIPQ